MAAPHIEAQNYPIQSTPLLNPSQTVLPQEEPNDAQLNHSLQRLETFLRLFGFCQYSFLSSTLSWLSFLLLGVGVPLLVSEFSNCSDCDKYEIKSFELEILISRSLVAAISLLCVSHNLRKYGVRRFLFVDSCHGHMSQFREEYIQKINGFFCLLAVCVLPCFLLKTVREVTRIVYINHGSWCQSAATLFALLISWTYSNIIYVSGSAMFNLVCNLQVVHLENYGRLLERDLDVSVYIEEHTLITHQLSKISHRFRIFLLLQFIIVTASQFVSLLETTGNSGLINFINGGDFAVLSIVELVGIIICLHAAAKITHRAQGLASVTSRWHALVTCNTNDGSQLGNPNNGANTGAARVPLSMSYSEGELESLDFVPQPTTTQLASSTSSYHKRQAFVTYMQTNIRGATVFGWTIDRMLINTIFFVELSLVLFVLGKTITFTTK
ncbi:hypothetical protein FNV43_RR19593 [Rhamnella rubrinervis]|uniref:Uncharacterized protein n=1 Tax=Rhamnella rubrinervis TaxID=2594499 RepID=A0A8K0GWE0_9ROSA|nr:hypothetical protein FNV43_RR19593 [Rhamnella rubrinervis]